MIVLLALGLTACGSVNAPDDLPVIRYVQFRVYDPVYVAIDKGFFRERGVDVELAGDVIAGPNAIQAVSSGAAEAGLSSVPALINANAAGLPVQGVVDIQTTMPSQALQRWYVRADSPITSLEDAPEGTRYAVNIWRSSFHYTSLLALDQRDIPEDKFEWQLLSFSNQIPALIEGEVDIIGLIEPYQAYLEDEYGAQVRELYNDYDDVYGTRHVSLIFVNRIWARENPDQAEAFVTAIAEATQWVLENQDEAKEIIEHYTEIPAESQRNYHFTASGEVRMQDIEVWMEYLKERGDLTADWLKPEDVGTNIYNQLVQ